MSAKTQRSNNGQFTGRYPMYAMSPLFWRSFHSLEIAAVLNFGNSFLEWFWMEMVVVLRSLFKGFRHPRFLRALLLRGNLAASVVRLLPPNARMPRSAAFCLSGFSCAKYFLVLSPITVHRHKVDPRYLGMRQIAAPNHVHLSVDLPEQIFSLTSKRSSTLHHIPHAWLDNLSATQLGTLQKRRQCF